MLHDGSAERQLWVQIGAARRDAPPDRCANDKRKAIYPAHTLIPRIILADPRAQHFVKSYRLPRISTLSGYLVQKNQQKSYSGR